MFVIFNHFIFISDIYNTTKNKIDDKYNLRNISRIYSSYVYEKK